MGDTILIVLWVLAVFGILAADGTQLFERAAARNNSVSCMELADPTVGTYSGSEELELLSRADPQASAYFVSTGVTVTPLDEATFVRCFGEQYSNNPVDTNVIFLNSGRLTTPALRAVAFAHELVHVEHGDSATAMGHHSLLHHLWMPEEGESHLRGIKAARKLHVRWFYPVWLDYVEWIYLLPISYVLLAALMMLCIQKVRRNRKAALLGRDRDRSSSSSIWSGKPH